jgi:hypothetical protein
MIVVFSSDNATSPLAGARLQRVVARHIKPGDEFKGYPVK